MAELIAVDGMTVIVDATTPTPAGAVVATITVLPPTGTKCQGSTKQVHRDGDKISVAAITVPSAGATIADPGPYVVALEAKGEKVSSEGPIVLREKDQSEDIDATPQIPGSPPTDWPVSFKCIIQVAGQVKASMN